MEAWHRACCPSVPFPVPPAASSRWDRHCWAEGEAVSGLTEAVTPAEPLPFPFHVHSHSTLSDFMEDQVGEGEGLHAISGSPLISVKPAAEGDALNMWAAQA